MIYLTYEEYNKLGGKVEQSAFPKLERQARKKLDYFTQDRLKNETVIPEEVKDCMAEFIDALAEYTQGEKVSSFSNGSVSVSFEKDEKDTDTRLWDIAVEYLPVRLISLAVD